jgi:hypothetical protein
MNLQLGNVHVPTLVAAVVVVLGTLALVGLAFRVFRKVA